MSRNCPITGKKTRFGRKFTYRGIAKKKKGIGLKITGCTNRRFKPNLKEKRLWIPEEKRFVTLRISMAGLRTIDKKGIAPVVNQLRKAGTRI